MTNNFENEAPKNGEIKTMVRKASELRSLNELGLSMRTYNSIKSIPPEELIFLVRTRRLHVKGMWQSCYDELYTAIDTAGFIRHDFEARSFGAGALYRAVFGADKDGKPYAHIWNFESNEAYESYISLSQAQLDAIDQLLDTLTPKEKTVVQLRFGLVDGKRHLLEDVASVIDRSRERIRQIEAKALRKLRHPNKRFKLEAAILYSSSRECNERIRNIEEELRGLRQQMNMLERRILDIREYSPFATVADAPKQFELSLSSRIETLHLSVRTYNCLMRASIGTIGDFVEHCSQNPKDWDKKIRNLGKKGAREVAETVTLLGWQIPVEDLS